MKMLGAEVVPVSSGSRTLKDAINEALRDWVANVDSTHYLLGTAAGAHPFPALVRDFTRGIGDEARAQSLELLGRLPDAALACVGGGSNAIGLFTGFLADESVRLYGFEAGGDGVDTGRHAATITAGDVGVLHGTRSFLLQDGDGQTIESHSISAGLDYPGWGPSMPGSPRPAGRRTGPSPTPRPWMPWWSWPRPRASSQPSRARTRSPAPSTLPASSGRRPHSWCACPAEETRTW